MTGLQAQIAYLGLIVRLERIRHHVRALLEQRKMQMPNLQALTSEFDKLRTEVEADARKLIDNDLAAARVRKKDTFDNARKKIGAIHGQLGEINQFFDAVDAATNGPPSSSGSQAPSVSAQPAEAAALHQGKPE